MEGTRKINYNSRSLRCFKLYNKGNISIIRLSTYLDFMTLDPSLNPHLLNYRSTHLFFFADSYHHEFIRIISRIQIQRYAKNTKKKKKKRKNWPANSVWRPSADRRSSSSPSPNHSAVGSRISSGSFAATYIKQKINIFSILSHLLLSIHSIVYGKKWTGVIFGHG